MGRTRGDFLSPLLFCILPGGRPPLIATATGHSFNTSLPVKRVMSACQYYILPVFKTSIYNNNSTIYTNLNSNYIEKNSSFMKENNFKIALEQSYLCINIII